MHIRREMNEFDLQAHPKAIDRLLNNGAYARLWTIWSRKKPLLKG